MRFTKILSSSTDTKFPISTNDDPKIFTFESVELFGMREVADFFKRNYVLNFPLKVGNFKGRRNFETLKECHVEGSEYIILDFDDVPDIKSRDNLLKLFKNFRHVSFRTPKADDVYNFNFRVVCWIPASTRHLLSKMSSQISKVLGASSGEISKTTYRKSQITPRGHNGILTINEAGHPLNMSTFKDAMSWCYTPDINRVVLHMFEELGFCILHEDENSADLTINQSNYRWFSSSPFVATNVLTGERVDISKEFKKRHKIETYRKAVSVKSLLENQSKRKITETFIGAGALDKKELSGVLAETIKDGGVLALRSPMGTGKTRIIYDFITKNESCLVITPRVSLAEELYSRLAESGAKCYNKHKLEPNTKVYICQFDSLFKINLNILKEKKFDCVIIDEVMTLCDHIHSSIAGNREFNIAKMLAMLNSANCVMVCDAFLEKIALDLLPQKFNKVQWVQNDMRDPTNVLIHANLNSFLGSLIQSSNDGVVVSCVSIPAARSLAGFLERAGHRVGLIQSSLDPISRDRILEDYNTKKISALVYTPSLSVGVNVVGTRGTHFHYDPGNVIPVIQSVQMVRRSRRAGTVEVFVKSSGKDFAPSLEEERSNVLNMCEGYESAAGVTFNELGERSLTSIGKFLALISFQNKIWGIDTHKTFARLCQLNFESVSRLDRNTKSLTFGNLSLRSTGNLKDFIKFQELEIYGKFSEEIQQSISADEVDDFIKFEQFYRVAVEAEGFERARENLVKMAHFGFGLELELFKELVRHQLPAKDYEQRSTKLNPRFVETCGVFFGKGYRLNQRFLKLCEKIHFSG